MHGALVILLIGGSVAACGASTVLSPSATATSVQTEEACMAALLQGMLVVDARSGLAVRPADGPVVPVRWPEGWLVRDGAPPDLVAPDGTVVATAGDLVSVGGGFVGDTWLACPSDIRGGLR